MSNQQEILNLNSIFQQHFLEPKNFFMYCYQQPPCITWVDMLNTEKALKYLKDEYGDVITRIYQYSKYERKKRRTEFSRTVITFRDNCIVELCSDWADILYTHEDYEMANALVKELSRFRRREKRKDFEINLVSKDSDGMDLKSMDLLIDNPDSILVIEDAENVITDRRISNDSSISNLLNISDGLLSDFLNVQVICTFNHPLSMVDAALMRKGRLIAKYEFGKLSTGKAQSLSKHLGFDTVIHEPMTIAEIANPHEKAYSPKQVEVIGFRRAVQEN